MQLMQQSMTDILKEHGIDDFTHTNAANFMLQKVYEATLSVKSDNKSKEQAFDDLQKAFLFFLDFCGIDASEIVQ
ncbi:MAG: hypothetical protein Q4C63_01500 [Eubacteriales bacterium]|nr:hypothetical protein [Eubacteriales bacterium]